MPSKPATSLASHVGQPVPSQNASLAQVGFTHLSDDVLPSVCVCSSGMEKRGKTYFAFTAPGPIAVIALDTGTEHVARAWQRAGKIVHYFDFRVPPAGLAIAAYERDWAAVERAYQAVLKSSEIRTLITDTATEVWEMRRLAEFGKLTQVMPHHYAQVNKAFKDFIKTLWQKPGLNSFWIHKKKKEYKTNKEGKDAWTGNWERAGFNDFGYLVDVSVEHYLRGASDGDPAQFGVQIIDARYRTAAVMGERIEGAVCSFPYLANLLLPDVPWEAWDDGIQI